MLDHHVARVSGRCRREKLHNCEPDRKQPTAHRPTLIPVPERGSQSRSAVLCALTEANERPEARGLAAAVRLNNSTGMGWWRRAGVHVKRSRGVREGVAGSALGAVKSVY